MLSKRIFFHASGLDSETDSEQLLQFQQRTAHRAKTVLKAMIELMKLWMARTNSQS